jgi:hypothetical protein
MPSAAAEIRVDDVDNAAPVTFDRLIIILVSSLLYKVNMLLQAYYQFSLVEIKLGLGIFYYQHLPQLTHGRSQSNIHEPRIIIIEGIEHFELLSQQTSPSCNHLYCRPNLVKKVEIC